MRHYILEFSRFDRAAVTPTPSGVSSNRKVGEIASVMFRRTFGRAPDKIFWQAKGFMAGASDKRGNNLTVTQENDDMHSGFDRRTGTFPLLKINQ